MPEIHTPVVVMDEVNKVLYVKDCGNPIRFKLPDGWQYRSFLSITQEVKIALSLRDAGFMQIPAPGATWDPNVRNTKIPCIKVVRRLSNVGLREAKQTVEFVHALDQATFEALYNAAFFSDVQ